jgi:hypothetical protein
VSVYDPVLPEPRRVAYALVPGEEEIAYVAEDSEVLTRVVVLQLVTQLRPEQIRQDQLERIRGALQDEDWQEAIIAWMDATGQRLNVFPDEPIWTNSGLDEARLRLELPLTPIFSGQRR